MNKFITRFLATIERLTGYIATITSDHAYIHYGKAFSISLDLGSISSVYYVSLDTPANTVGYIHFRPGSAGITTDANSVEYKLYENPTSYTGGSAYTPFNRNRNSSTVSGCTVKYGVTPTLGSAITIDNLQIGSTGAPNSRAGGSGGGNDEIILKPSETYIFAFTPAGATNVSFNCFWYEETSGV